MTSEEKKQTKPGKLAESQASFFPEQEENLQELVSKWVQKMKELRYKYPDVTDSIEHLQSSLKESMIQMKEVLNNLNVNDRDLLTLLIIHEIHKSVDSIFQLDDEIVDGER